MSYIVFLNKLRIHLYQAKNVSFVVTGKGVTILDLKVNQSPEAVNYKGNAVAIVQSTSATVIQVCYIISTI